MIRWIAAAIGFYVAAATLAVADQRVALVIGNANYAAPVTSLANAGNDAEDMAQALSQLGFEVTVATDMTRADMIKSLEQFSAQVETADVALFYFAGHGFQVDGENFLAPIDLDVGGDVGAQVVLLGDVLRVLSRAKGIKIVILDACRNHPEGLIADSDVTRGFSKIESARDFLVSYATQPGAVSWDGTGRNGMYTGALLANMFTPGLSITDMLVNVRRDVIARTGGQQVPWDNSSLTQQFSFASGKRVDPPEVTLFQVAVRSRSERLMQLFLELYPNGPHVKTARAHLDGGFRDIEIVEGDDQSLADELYAVITQTRNRSLSQYFADTYPNHNGVLIARELAETAPEFVQENPDIVCERLATHPNDASVDLPGVQTATLYRHAARAISACRTAITLYPEQPRFKSLAARAYAASGDWDNAIALYREAADEGDLRALVSIAHLMQSERWVERDLEGAERLYRLAAQAGSPDGANNAAFLILSRRPTPEETQEALDLLVRAYESGSAEAAFNLGYLSARGTYGTREEAVDFYLAAAERGDFRGFREAAVLMQHGVGREPDPAKAATMLLRGAASDDGTVVSEFIAGASVWLPETVKALQETLVKARLLTGVSDGVPGPATTRAITLWRNGGYDSELLGL